MADKLDLSLEDIIKISKKTNRGGGRGRGGQRRGRGTGGGVSSVRNTRGRGRGRGRSQGSFTRSKAPNDKWDHDMYTPGKQSYRNSSATGRSSGGTGKLLVSNLEFGVSDSDINELFSEFGALRKAAVHYDRSGRSLGSADVHFERRTDASRALQQYNGVPLDGRVMQIRFVDGQSATNQNGSSRFTNGGSYGRSQRPSRGTFGRGRGRGRGRGGGRQQRKEVSAEELDKQLDDYISKTED